ncbi:nucleotide disphospho-sugar-binding domain-containing protein [Jannaschia sp. W003]|uniref:nucleotide disphospho-sugar-binding domain-containing protein n=1 Tax=Jannaschia sp. W003 TaxID=2867012 RepID=UPI0021A57A45|nr:nucleotide disphospho-sugar-binding domain-containing protein [Jannaschia sp. W003]UWQ20743.1 hypothetical protein K3554_12255 [Jannaschia sp. W003]
MTEIDTTSPPLAWSGVRRLPGLEGRIHLPNRGAVLLSTIGSLGDLYPVLSVARAIELAGLEPRLALSPDDCEIARSWGLLATPVGPTQAELCERLGVSRDEIAASILRDPGPLMRDVMIPMLPALIEQMAPLMPGVSVAAGTTFALAAPLAAEQAGVPYVPLLLQPMMMFSAIDPPTGRLFKLARQNPGTAGQVWNRALLSCARAVLRSRHASDLSDVRDRLALPPQPGTPLLDHGGEVPMRLALWDEHFAPIPDDAPEGLRAVGFPPRPEGMLDPEVRRWIAGGPPPLVVTMGSIAHGLGGPKFWQRAVDLGRSLGLRVVLLHGQAEVPEGDDVLALPYAPHSGLFPLAAAIVHHGGIGTTAEAVRAARPQLVLPVGGDQPDNAARLERMDLAAVLPVRRFGVRRAQQMLGDLLERFDYAAAAKLGEAVADRNGAGEAALHLARIALASRDRRMGRPATAA